MLRARTCVLALLLWKGELNMPEWLTRTKALIGEENCLRLSDARVAVLGLGGVGGACAEALCRSGIGTLILIDRDTVSLSNLNRQLFATLDTVGLEKTQAAKARLSSVSPDCKLITLTEFYLPENRDILFSQNPDFVVDAIDTVTAKLDLMETCFHRGIPLISCMGTGNRLDPSQFTIGDIADTAGSGDNLAKVIRRELKKRGVPKQPVLFSTEQPQKIGFVGEPEFGRHAPASIGYTPPAAGYLLAGYVVRSLLGMEKTVK